jgi:hypothetical protein
LNKLDEAGVDEEGRQDHADNPVWQGIDQPLIKNFFDFSEINRFFLVMIDQCRLFIASCRNLYGRTLKGLSGQRERNGKTTFFREPHGFSVSASY